MLYIFIFDSIYCSGIYENDYNQEVEIVLNSSMCWRSKQLSIQHGLKQPWVWNEFKCISRVNSVRNACPKWHCCSLELEAGLSAGNIPSDRQWVSLRTRVTHISIIVYWRENNSYRDWIHHLDDNIGSY